MRARPTETSVLVPAPDIVWRKVADETVLLDPDASVLLGVNDSAGRVWALLDGHRSLGEIAAELAKAYGQPVSRILADVLAFAATLLERGLASLAAGEPLEGDEVERPPT